MAATLSIEDEKSIKKALLVAGMALCVAALVFLVLSAASLWLVHLGVCNSGGQDCCLFVHNEWQFSGIFASLKDAYSNWFNVLNDNNFDGQRLFLLWVPIIVPFLSLTVLIILVLRSSYSFTLWYVLNNHFAKLSDITKMGLLENTRLVLGRFGDYLLGTSKAAAILCVGETGCGKTSTIAVPSILRSDEMTIVAVDNSGTLARHSSGYRAKLGPIYYFNWDIADEPEKDMLYPHWNPLAEENLPDNEGEKKDYLDFLASYMVAGDGLQSDDNYWKWLASGTLSTFISFLLIKCKQAEANDYFLGQILEKSRLSSEDKDILLSYYAMMPEKYFEKASVMINKSEINSDDYFPIGSWEGIPETWQGKRPCLGMLVDWLVQNYLAGKANRKVDWRAWIEKLLFEASVFNYGLTVIKGLQQFLYLSAQQRELVFAQMLRPLKVFVNQTVREKTSDNDFTIKDLQGKFNSETQKFEPITIYTTAKTKTTKFINRLFMDVLLRYGVIEQKQKNIREILMVFDDVGQMVKVRSLSESVARGPDKGVSFLLLCNSLNNLELTYGREILENLVSNTEYKIIMADSSSKMSRQLNKMAIFASKSVQIPKDKRRIFKSKPHFSDTNYFHRLAVDLQVKKNLQIKTMGYQLLLINGYYHRPVLTKNTSFVRDILFMNKAAEPAVYFLDERILKNREQIIMDVPSVDAVLMDSDLGIDDEVELNQYIDVVYNDVRSKVPEDPKMEAVMIDDISTKWRKKGNEQQGVKSILYDEWWLDENAFGVETSNNLNNPFMIKK